MKKTMMFKMFMKQILLLCLFFCIPICSLKAQLKGVKGKNGKWGLMNSEGKMISQFIYSYIGNYNSSHEGNEPVSLKDQFHEGLVPVFNQKSGAIDTTGKVIIPLIYDECGQFENGTALVFLNEKCGLIDKTGKVLIPIKYGGYLTRITDNLWIATNALSKFGLVTRSGKELLPTIYNMIEFGSNFGIITLNKKKGYFNSDGEITVPCKYDDARFFREGIAPVMLNDKWGYIDIGGKVVIPLVYDFYDSKGDFIKNGKARLVNNNKFEDVVKPNIKPPLTAKEVLAYHINDIGGQLNLSSIKNCRFTVQTLNYKKILYTTSLVNISGVNINANIYDNNSKQTTERVMTSGAMWFKENSKVSKEEDETDNLFLYSLPSLLINAEKLGYQLVYDPKKCEESGVVYVTVKGKEALRTEYGFAFNSDYSINSIKIRRGDSGYTLANFKYSDVAGISVLSEWSSSQFGEELLVWTIRKDFQVNVKMDDKLFIKPL